MRSSAAAEQAGSQCHSARVRAAGLTVHQHRWRSGQAAALAGGTTFHIDFALPIDGDLAAGFARYQRAAQTAVMDYSFHMAVTSWDDKVGPPNPNPILQLWTTNQVGAPAAGARAARLGACKQVGSTAGLGAPASTHALKHTPSVVAVRLRWKWEPRICGNEEWECGMHVAKHTSRGEVCLAYAMPHSHSACSAVGAGAHAGNM